MKTDHLKTNRYPFSVVLQTLLLSRRSLISLFRQPAVVTVGLFISLFFFFVNEASIGRAIRFIPGMQQINHIALLVPLSIISVALHSQAGMEILRDCTKGYFEKLLLTPVSRTALLLGPILASTLLMLIQISIVFSIGFIMGLKPTLGWRAIAIIYGFAVAMNMGFAAFIVSIALRTNSEAATQSAELCFFPLSFLTDSFVPIDVMGGWLKIATYLNPVTYILRAMRSVLLKDTFDYTVLLQAFVVCVLFIIIAFAFALRSLSTRTSMSGK